MRSEVAFVAGYAVILLAAAAVLHRLGRRNSAAWASPALAAYRRQFGAPEPAPTDWPHRDVGRLHTAVGLVAALAAGLLVTAELVRFHRLADAALLGPVGAGTLVVVAYLARRLRR
ncbi:MAG TPA: hypothetical protein VMU51_35070 [Mycobacteriales bacterium]|nr:hypothetical protein [Mycobacteriales bacterium]